MECPDQIRPLIIEKSNMGVRAMHDLASFLLQDIPNPAERLTILLSIAIQGVYNIAIELEEGENCDEKNSAALALKYFLDGFASVEPNVIKAGTDVPTSDKKESMH